VLTVAPSKDKAWVPGRAPWELGALVEIPRVLLEKVAMAKVRRGRQLSKEVAKVPAGGKGAAVAAAATPLASFTASHPVEKLLLLLSKTRWESYASWRDIATALKNSYGEDFRSSWDRLSRLCPNYEPEAAEKLWATVCQDRYDGPRLTKRTLERWAREDDPHGYAMYRASCIPAVVMDNWEKGDYGLGQIVSELLKPTVKKTGAGRNDFYLFDEDTCRWGTADEGRVKSVACRALDDALRDVEIWCAARASQCSVAEDREKVDLDAKKKTAASMIKYVRSQRGISNVMGFAGPLLSDDTFEQRLDSRPYLIGLKGGYVVDLRSGEKRASVAEDMIHVELDVEYDESIATPSWFPELIRTTMGGDEAMVRYLQMLLGYGITGEVSEEVFPIWTGSGRNGKGLIMQALQQLLGAFYRELNCAIISDSRVCSNIDAERAKLLGARLAVFNELKAGERLKTNEVQLLTGGDGIPAKALYKDPITIQPRHLCVLTTNYMPELNEVIMAMIERLLCIEFPVTFRDLMPGESETATLRQVDKTLKERLKSPEGQAALFAWLVEGAVRWYAVGRGSLKRAAPDKVKATTKEYLEEQDRVQAFLVEHCEFGEEKRASSQELFSHYRDMTGHKESSDKWFHAQLKNKGFLKKSGLRMGGGGKVMGYEGLSVKYRDTETESRDELDG